MSVPSALANVLRLLLLGLLLCGVVLKPSLAIAEEMHELLSHATVAGDGHTHADAHSVEIEPTRTGDPQPHDDNHFHLTHCCGQQAAVLPRLDVAVPLLHGDSPIPPQTVAFAPAPYIAPFRPPIAA